MSNDAAVRKLLEQEEAKLERRRALVVQSERTVRSLRELVGQEELQIKK